MILNTIGAGELQMQWRGMKLDDNSKVIQHIRKVIHLIPIKCTIKIYYDDIQIIPEYTPPEHHELYYMLKNAGLLEEYIAYGKYKLTKHNALPKPKIYPCLAFSRERESKALTCKPPSCVRPSL